MGTHSKSREYNALQRNKWAVGAIAAEIKSTTAAALEPLDEQKLREIAMHGLMDKAKFRMRMEGLSAEQQELVLAEFPVVLAETTSNGPSPAVSGFASAVMSGRKASNAAEEANMEPF